MSPAAEIESDPSVCYRHPGRTSWTLCERCGRTICPECQILTPAGVRCPQCVQELGGSVQWQPAGGAPRSTRGRAKVVRSRPRWQQAVLELVRPGSSAPVLSWSIVGIVIVLWIAGFFTSNAPVLALAAIPGSPPWQLWRFFTSPFGYPAALAVAPILSLVLNVLFFLLSAPAVERSMGRRNFLVVFFTATAVSSAGMVLAGSPGYGLIGPLFGLFGAALVAVWSNPALRIQYLVLIAINIVANLLFGGYTLPAVIGGALGGVGAALLLRYFGERPRSRPSTPYLLLAGAVVVFILIAIIRGLL